MGTIGFETEDGVPLNARVDGEGPPLLLFNGAYCTVHQWDLVVPGLAEHFTVIRHDIRGSGQSSGGERDRYTFEQYAADAVALLDHTGASGPAHVWGMAWGARVALMVAARHRERVARVVLSDLGIDPADVEAQKAGYVAAREARAEAGIAEVAKPSGFNTHRDVKAARRAMAATALHPDLMPVVRAVKQPVLIATGEHDPNMASSRRALGGLDDGRLEVLPLTGHGSVLQRPDLVLARVLPFLLELFEGPVDLAKSTIGLDRDGRACLVPSRPGPPRRIDGLSIGVPMMTTDPPHAGEMHPDGDELIYVVSGRISVRIEDRDPPRVCELTSGEAVIIPRGVWHLIRLLEPSRMLHVTPGPGGEYRPLADEG